MRLARYIMILILLIPLMNAQGEVDVLLVSITQDENGTYIDDVNTFPYLTTVSESEENATYSLRLIEGSLYLYEINFSFPPDYHTSDPAWFNEEGEQIYFPEDHHLQNIVLRLPYVGFTSQSSLQLYDHKKDQVVDEYSLDEFSYNPEEETEDTGFSSEGIKNEEENTSVWLWIGGFLILVIVALSIFALIRKRNQ